MTSATADIRTIFDRYVAAIEGVDPKGLLALYGDDIHVFDSMGAVETHGIDAWGATVQEWLGNPDVRQECHIEDLVVIDNGDVALARALVQYRGEWEGQMQGMWNRATWGLRRIDGDWKIIHEHTSVAIDDETMQPIFERES